MRGEGALPNSLEGSHSRTVRTILALDLHVPFVHLFVDGKPWKVKVGLIIVSRGL